MEEKSGEELKMEWFNLKTDYVESGRFGYRSKKYKTERILF